VYSAQCRVRLCVQCTVQSETVCTVHSAEWDCVYSAQCRVRLCVQCTVQSETVYVSFNIFLEQSSCAFSWINKRRDEITFLERRTNFSLRESGQV